MRAKRQCVAEGRQVLGRQAGKRCCVPDEPDSSPAQACFARNLYLFPANGKVLVKRLRAANNASRTRDRLPQVTYAGAGKR
jgi:hypothetical protein